MNLLLALLGFLFVNAELTSIRDTVVTRYGQYYSTGTYGHVQQIHAIDLDRGVATVEWHHDCLASFDPRYMCAFTVLVVRDPDGDWTVGAQGRTWRTPIPDGVDMWTF